MATTNDRTLIGTRIGTQKGAIEARRSGGSRALAGPHVAGPDVAGPPITDAVGCA